MRVTFPSARFLGAPDPDEPDNVVNPQTGSTAKVEINRFTGNVELTLMNGGSGMGIDLPPEKALRLAVILRDYAERAP